MISQKDLSFFIAVKHLSLVLLANSTNYCFTDAYILRKHRARTNPLLCYEIAPAWSRGVPLHIGILQNFIPSASGTDSFDGGIIAPMDFYLKLRRPIKHPRQPTCISASLEIPKDTSCARAPY